MQTRDDKPLPSDVDQCVVGIVTIWLLRRGRLEVDVNQVLHTGKGSHDWVGLDGALQCGGGSRSEEGTHNTILLGCAKFSGFRMRRKTVNLV
jgi:hypothetical protein